MSSEQEVHEKGQKLYVKDPTVSDFFLATLLEYDIQNDLIVIEYDRSEHLPISTLKRIPKGRQQLYEPKRLEQSHSLKWYKDSDMFCLICGSEEYSQLYTTTIILHMILSSNALHWDSQGDQKCLILKL